MSLATIDKNQALFSGMVSSFLAVMAYKSTISKTYFWISNDTSTCTGTYERSSIHTLFLTNY